MGRPHVMVIPYPAQGHVNPMMNFSQHLSKHHGFKITFVNTHFNHTRILSASSSMSPSTIPHHHHHEHEHVDGDDGGIDLVSIPDGMGPEEDRNELDKLCDSILSTMPTKLEELILGMMMTTNNNLEGGAGDHDDDVVIISCIVADVNMGWVREVGEKLGIRVAAFWPASTALLSLESTIPSLIRDRVIDDDGFPIKEQMIQLAPNMPTFDTANLPWRIGDPKAQKSIFRYIKTCIHLAKPLQWQLCNSTPDLEPSAFHLLPNLLPIGPVTGPSGPCRPHSFWEEDSTCLTWLDQHPPNSVIYVAFGSLAIFNQTQLQELALGLHLTNRPFLWVVRPGIAQESHQETFLHVHGSFRSHAGRISPWVPQQRVLRHPSIGCFVSHCGWNSTMEGLSSGVPFLCWPYFADQFMNRDYICDVWRVGLGVEKDVNGIICKEEIKEKLELLFGDENIRARSLEFKELLNSSNGGESGQSSVNMRSFINWLKA